MQAGAAGDTATGSWLRHADRSKGALLSFKDQSLKVGAEKL